MTSHNTHLMLLVRQCTSSTNKDILLFNNLQNLRNLYLELETKNCHLIYTYLSVSNGSEIAI